MSRTVAFRLPRLPRNVALVDGEGRPARIFQQWFQSLVESIEGALNSIQANVDAIAAAQAAATAAQAAADAADAAAANAQGAADAITAESNLLNSYVTGCTITASDAGASASITISTHTRTYGNGATVSVTGSSVTGLSYSTTYFIYYVDAARTGGAVTYQATTTQATAAQTGDTHLVGAVTTPAALAADTTGGGILPPKLSDVYNYTI